MFKEGGSERFSREVTKLQGEKKEIKRILKTTNCNQNEQIGRYRHI
jgi:hypothetical protein